MEWKEVEPEQKDWQKQWNLTAYYGEHIVGSIILDDDGEGEFNSVIDGVVEFMVSSDLEEAKKEFYDRLQSHFESEIEYYNALLNMLDEINN